MLFLLALRLPAAAQSLPPPHALGGHCQLLVPCAESGPFAAHLRGLLELREAPAEREMQVGGHLGLSFSFFDWGEGGVSLYGLHGAVGLAQGPVTMWGRVSPQFLRWTGGQDDVAALRLAVQVEYAAAFPPFDGQGTLFPSTHTYLAVADAMAWRIRASLSAGPQLADGGGPGYRGLQAGAGLWLRMDGAGVQAGAEVLGRAGTQAGAWRSEWTAALSVRMFDGEGHQVKGGLALPSGGGASILVGYGFSCGPSYAASTCFRGLGRSLFERTQERLGAAILAAWRARKEAERLAELYAAAHPPPVGRWITGRAFDPPPPSDCPPSQPAIRIYPCRRQVAPFMLGTTLPLQVMPPPPPEGEAAESDPASEDAEGAPVPPEVNPWGSGLLRRPQQGPPRVGAGVRVPPPPEQLRLPFWGDRIPDGHDSIGPARGRSGELSPPPPRRPAPRTAGDRPGLDWVDENPNMPDRAKDYQAGTPGARSNVASRSSQAPMLTYRDASGQNRTVKFDGQDGDVLVDRKVSVPNRDKTQDQILRQSMALSQNHMKGRWEVPTRSEAIRAMKLMKRLNVDNIEIKVVP